ncbi:hypothetical protein BDA99DRAFT_219425 [Phascolomyces articulosus]|uniref:Transmembrane protein n=1 Tax=Phascolomyces articulosus TaxID=60185 RepID=A0AAD5PAR5_9FUNG|nr:hypothetical protein BDA99DRAFT_219425 [Phascolomyces articulosus]
MSHATFVNTVHFSLALVAAAIIGTAIRAFVVVTHAIWFYCRYKHPLWSATIAVYAYIAYCFLFKCSYATQARIAVRMSMLIGMTLPSPLLPAILPFSNVPLRSLRKFEKKCIRPQTYCQDIIDDGLGDWEQASFARPVSVVSVAVPYNYPVPKSAVVEDTPIVRNENENEMVDLIERFVAMHLHTARDSSPSPVFMPLVEDTPTSPAEVGDATPGMMQLQTPIVHFMPLDWSLLVQSVDDENTLSDGDVIIEGALSLDDSSFTSAAVPEDVPVLRPVDEGDAFPVPNEMNNNDNTAVDLAPSGSVVEWMDVDSPDDLSLSSPPAPVVEFVNPVVEPVVEGDSSSSELMEVSYEPTNYVPTISLEQVDGFAAALAQAMMPHSSEPLSGSSVSEVPSTDWSVSVGSLLDPSTTRFITAEVAEETPVDRPVVEGDSSAVPVSSDDYVTAAHNYLSLSLAGFLAPPLESVAPPSSSSALPPPPTVPQEDGQEDALGELEREIEEAIDLVVNMTDEEYEEMKRNFREVAGKKMNTF